MLRSFVVSVSLLLVCPTLTAAADSTSSTTTTRPLSTYKIDMLLSLPPHLLLQTNSSSTRLSQTDRLALFAHALGEAEQRSLLSNEKAAPTETEPATRKQNLPSKCFRSSSRALLRALNLTWPNDFPGVATTTSQVVFDRMEKQVIQVATFIRRFRRLQADKKGNGGLLQYPSNTIVVDASLINAVESAVTTMMRSKDTSIVNTARLCFALPRLLTILGPKQEKVASTTKKPRVDPMPTVEEHVDYDYYRNMPTKGSGNRDSLQASPTTATADEDFDEVQTDDNLLLSPLWMEPPDNSTDLRELIFCPFTVRRRHRNAAQYASNKNQQQLHVHRQDISNPAALSGARPTPSLDDHGDANTENQANVELSAYEAVLELLKDIDTELPSAKAHVMHNGSWTAPYLDCHHLAMSFIVRTAVNWRTSAGQELWPFLIADVDIARNLRNIINPCHSSSSSAAAAAAAATPFDSLSKCPPSISTCITDRDYDFDGGNEINNNNLSIVSEDEQQLLAGNSSDREKKRHPDDDGNVAVKNSLKQRQRSSSSSEDDDILGSSNFNDILAQYSCICATTTSEIAALHNLSTSPRRIDSSIDEIEDNDNYHTASLSSTHLLHHHKLISGRDAERAWYKHIAQNDSQDYLALFQGCHFAPVICPSSSTTRNNKMNKTQQNSSQFVDCISRQRLASMLARIQYQQEQPKSILWRGAPLGAQSFCLTCAIFLLFIVARYRRQKEMKISKWRLLSTMLAGACLLYGSVICEYFMPNERRWLCIVDAWLRELGFVAFYGSIYLQIYWYYTQIQTRSAHLRLQLNERELLKLLGIMLAVAIMYLACWTSLYVQLGTLGTDDGQQQQKIMWCALPRGDNIAWACEILFLLWTLFYAYKVRHVRSAKPFAIALVLELLVSAATMGSVHMLTNMMMNAVRQDGVAESNIIFAIMFARCQLTVTVIILLVMVPRMWRMHKPDPHLVNARRVSNQTAGASSTSAGVGGGTAAERQRLSSSANDFSSNNNNNNHDNHLRPSSAAALGGAHGGGKNSTSQPRYVHMAGDMNNRLSDGNLIVSSEELASLPISEMDPEDIRAELKRVYTQMQMLRNKAMRKDNPHISKKRGGKRVGGARRFSLQALNLRLHRDSTSDDGNSGSARQATSTLSHLQQLLAPPTLHSTTTDAAAAAARTPDNKPGEPRRNSQEPQHAMPTLWEEEADKEEE